MLFCIIRVFNLLYFIEKFRVVFTTIRNLYDTLTCLFYTLISFFFIFTNISMVLIGGEITINNFKENLIPSYYYLINFNDLILGFFTCFSLTMVNNMNIITDALSRGSTFLTIYFNSFYLISFVLIFNLCYTSILDMFININNKLKLNKIVTGKINISENSNDGIENLKRLSKVVGTKEKEKQVFETSDDHDLLNKETRISIMEHLLKKS